MEHQPQHPQTPRPTNPEVRIPASSEHEPSPHRNEQIDDPHPEQDPTHPTPRIYIVSTWDEAAGNTHAAWIRADQSASDIHAEIATFLDTSPLHRHRPNAKPGEAANSAPGQFDGSAGWEIRDHENFCGITPYGEVDLGRLSILGTGLALHGPVFGMFAEHLGHEFPPEQWSAKFEDLYLGSEPSMKACIDGFLEAMGWTNALDYWIRTEGIDEDFIAFRYETIAKQYKEAFTVLTDENGAVHVFSK